MDRTVGLGGFRLHSRGLVMGSCAKRRFILQAAPHRDRASVRTTVAALVSPVGGHHASRHGASARDHHLLRSRLSVSAMADLSLRQKGERHDRGHYRSELEVESQRPRRPAANRTVGEETTWLVSCV